MPRAVEPEDLERAATRLAEALGNDGMLVGGLAVSAWGYVRATDDINFVANLPASAVVERLESAGIQCRVRKGDVLESDTAWSVSATLGGVVFDVLPPLVPLDFDRAVTVPLSKGAAIRVVDLDGLLRLMLRAGGPQDLLDAAQLLRRHPELVDRIRPIAEAYALWDRLEASMKDSRLR